MKDAPTAVPLSVDLHLPVFDPIDSTGERVESGGRSGNARPDGLGGEDGAGATSEGNEKKSQGQLDVPTPSIPSSTLPSPRLRLEKDEKREGLT